MEDKIKRDMYVKHLQELYKELGRTPRTKDSTLHTSISTFFGSWNNALVEAGLTLNRQSRNLTKEDLLILLNKGIGAEKYYVSKSEWDSKKIISAATLMSRFEFNSWDDLLEGLLGIENPIKRLNVDKDAFMEELKVFLITNEIKTRKDYDENRSKTMPSSSQILYALNMKWMELLKELNVDTSKTIRSKEDLKKIIIDLSNELNRTPSANDVRNKFGENTAIINSIKRYFGSWNNCLNELGICTKPTPIKVTHSKKELLQLYKDLSEKLGRAATIEDLKNSENIPNYTSYKIRFGGIKEIQDLLGYQYRGTATKKYTKKEITKLLYYLKVLKGSKLTDREVNEYISVSTILSYFHKTNMSDVWKCIDDISSEFE